MADRYWVGGTGTWDNSSTTNWSATSGGAGGASVPTSADNVFFNSSSGAGTVTVNQVTVNAASLTCTGYTGSIQGNGSNSNIQVVGNITLSTSMNFGAGSLDVIITGTCTLTNGGASSDSVTYQVNSGAVVTLGNALTLNIAGSLIVNGGTFSTANYSVTLGSMELNGGTTNLGSSTVTISFRWSVSGAATLNAGTSTITYSGGSSPSLGSKTYYNFSFTNTNPEDFTIDGSNTFNTLTLPAPSSTGIITYVFDGNQTITTLVASGASAIRRIGLYSDGFAISPRTLTITTWSSIADIDFRGITLNSTRSGTRLGNCGGNTNITFPAPKTVYWNLAGTQDWSATAWATSSGGTPAVNNFPLAQDTAIFDEAGAAGTVNLNNLWNIGTVNMSSRTTAVAINFPATQNGIVVCGNWINGSGTTFSGAAGGFLRFAGGGSQTITSAGKSFPLRIISFAVSLTLQDALTISHSVGIGLDLAGSAFNANNYNVTISGGNTVDIRATTVNLGSGTWTVEAVGTNAITGSSFTTYSGTATIRMTGATAKTFAGGSGVYSGITVDQAGAGALSITGANTFGNITNSYNATGAATITLAANQTVENFTATGVSGRVLTLNSSVSGTRRTLTKTGGGTVSVDYMSIQDSGAAGTNALWYAGYNSTNVSNNTGWLFTSPVSGSFLVFFGA